jgi:hypothetical protein
MRASCCQAVQLHKVASQLKSSCWLGLGHRETRDCRLGLTVVVPARRLGDEGDSQCKDAHERETDFILVRHLTVGHCPS